MSRSNILEVTNLSDLKSIIEMCVTVILGFTVHDTPNELKVQVRKFLKRKSEQFPLITFVYMEVSDEDRKTLNILGGEPEDYPKIFHIRGGNTILVSVPSATVETMNESFAAVEDRYVKEMKVFQAMLKDETDKKSKFTKEKNEDTDNNNIKTQRDTMSDNDNNDDVELSDDDNVGPSAGKPVGKMFGNSADKTSGNKMSGNAMSQNNKRTENKSKIQLMPNINPKFNMNIGPDDEARVQLSPNLEKKKNLEKIVVLNNKRDEMALSLLGEIAKRKKLENAAEKKDDKKKDDYGKEYRKNVRKSNR